MRKWVSKWLAIAILVLAATSYGVLPAHAALADGTYTADYLVLKAEDDSVSMANDYWEKPATIIVKNGKFTVKLTINHSKWVTEFKVPRGSSYADTKVVSKDEKADKRVVEFAVDAVDAVDQPIISKIHVTVEEIDYDHDYTIRIVFKEDSIKLVEAAQVPVVKEEPPAATGQDNVANPPSGTSTQTPEAPAAEPEPAASNSPPATNAGTQTGTGSGSAVTAGTNKPAEAAKPSTTPSTTPTVTPSTTPSTTTASGTSTSPAVQGGAENGATGAENKPATSASTEATGASGSSSTPASPPTEPASEPASGSAQAGEDAQATGGTAELPAGDEGAEGLEEARIDEAAGETEANPDAAIVQEDMIQQVDLANEELAVQAAAPAGKPAAVGKLVAILVAVLAGAGAIWYWSYRRKQTS